MILDNFAGFFNSSTGKVALKSGSISVSYNELGPITDHLANVVTSKNIGDTFFYLGRPGVLPHLYFVACLKARKAFISINRKLTPANVLSIVAELGPDRLIFVDEHTDVKNFYGLEFEVLPDLPVGIEGARGTSAKAAPLSDQIVLYNTTSGSTGVPKIIPVTFSDLNENIRLTELAWDFGPDDIIGNPGEFCAEHMIVTFARGATMSFSHLAEQSAQITRDWLNQDKISILICYIAIFRAFRYIEGQFEYLQQIGTYGDTTLPSDLDLFNRLCLAGSRYHSFLALQEIAYVTRQTWMHGEKLANGPITIGRPVLDNSVFVADEHGYPLESGQIGEIVIRAPMLSNFITGYVGGRKGSGRLIQNEGLTIGFGIGDLAFQNDDGSLYFMGRSDDQVKISGFNIRLLEVERAVGEIEGVSEAAITVQGYQRENRILCCHYIGDASLLDLRNDLKSTLPHFMVPHHFFNVIDLPRTATGKVDKSGLRVDFEKRMKTTADADLTIFLKSLWIELLGHSDFGMEGNFLEVGGDSLALIKMSLAVEERTGLHISFDSFEQAGMSIKALATLIESSSAPATAEQTGKMTDHIPPRLTPTENPGAKDLLILNRMILERWAATPAAQSKYFRCEHPAAHKISVFWVFQTEFEYQSLTKALGKDYCVYGARSMSSFSRFFSNGPQDDMDYYTDENVAFIAKAYLSEIVALAGTSPIILGGNCQAGIISLCVADMLSKMGIAIKRLVVLNPVEDRQDYNLPTTLLFGKAEFDAFSNEPKGLQSFPDAIVRQIDGDHGQYFKDDHIGQIVAAILDA